MRSSHRRARWVWSCAQAKTNSAAKSRSMTASRAFGETAAKPRSRARASRSRGSAVPARAPEPRGRTFDAPPRVAEALEVAHEGPGVGRREMAEGDGLGGAGVGVAGHHRLGPLLALRRQGPHERGGRGPQAVDGRADPEAQRGHRLLVAAPPQVALAREVAHDLAQAGLHEAVDVLDVEVEVGRGRPRRAAGPRRGPRPGPGPRPRGCAGTGRGPGRRPARPRSPRRAGAGRTRTTRLNSQKRRSGSPE